MNNFILSVMTCALAASGWAVTPDGGIDNAMMERLRASYKNTPADKAISNALRSTDIDVLATAADNKNGLDDNFTHKVKSKDRKSVV